MQQYAWIVCKILHKLYPCIISNVNWWVCHIGSLQRSMFKYARLLVTEFILKMVQETFPLSVSYFVARLASLGINDPFSSFKSCSSTLKVLVDECFTHGESTNRMQKRELEFCCYITNTVQESSWWFIVHYYPFVHKGGRWLIQMLTGWWPLTGPNSYLKVASDWSTFLPHSGLWLVQICTTQWPLMGSNAYCSHLWLVQILTTQRPLIGTNT